MTATGGYGHYGIFCFIIKLGHPIMSYEIMVTIIALSISYYVGGAGT